MPYKILYTELAIFSLLTIFMGIVDCRRFSIGARGMVNTSWVASIVAIVVTAVYLLWE